MGIVALSTFKKYAKKLEDDSAGEALYQIYLDAAEAVVEKYLGYSPVLKDYDETLYGAGRDTIQLRAKPVTELTAVTVDGTPRDVADFRLDGELLIDKTGAIFPRGAAVRVEYKAGWATVPADIQLCILQIASLKGMEAGENIGVTATSFDGGNSRTFINYTDFRKWLKELSSYRVVRL